MNRWDCYAEDLAEYDDDRLYEELERQRNFPQAIKCIVWELEHRELEVPTDLQPSDTICRVCGQLKGIEEYDHQLWDLYHRWDGGGRQYIEPLVYTQSDFEDMGYHSMYDMDDESIDSVKLSMEKNMAERGLCTECGRPNLAGIPASDFMSKEDAREIADMYAEMAAERRMGC